MASFEQKLFLPILIFRIPGKKLVFFDFCLYPVRIVSEATTLLKGGDDGKN